MGPALGTRDTCLMSLSPTSMLNILADGGSYLCHTTEDSLHPNIPVPQSVLDFLHLKFQQVHYLLKVTANSDQPSEIETRMSACSHLPSFVAIASSVWAHCPHLPSLSILILADLS